MRCVKIFIVTALELLYDSELYHGVKNLFLLLKTLNLFPTAIETLLMKKIHMILLQLKMIIKYMKTFVP